MGDQTAQFTEEYCAEKMKIIALIIALLGAVAASSEISGDSNERVVPEESLVSEAWYAIPGYTKHTFANGGTVTGYHAWVPHIPKKMVVKKHVSKIVKKHKKSVKKLFKKVKKAAKNGKKGAIKKMLKKHIKKLKRRVNKRFKRHFRRSRRSSRRGRRSIRQRGTKWECSWNHNPWFPCSPRPGDVVVPPYNGYWTKRHRKRSRKRRRL